MIIEIKDLPEGRKVSRILVDVTFEDSGEPQVVSQGFLNETGINTKANTKNDQGAPETPVTIVNPEIKRDPSTNPSIPTEMLDMEF